MHEHSFEFYIPEGAKIIEGSAVTEHGNPLKAAPVPESAQNRYAFEFPLRPGITHFQVIYKLTYGGSATIDPQSIYPLQHFLAIVPRSMEFSAAPGANFKPLNDPNQPEANVQIASATTLGQTLAFKVRGEGTLQPRVDNSSATSENTSAPGANRPGRGLGPPIETTDPLEKYRWYILGGTAAVFVMGGMNVRSRRQATRTAPRQDAQSLKFEEPNFNFKAADGPGNPAQALRASHAQSSLERSPLSMLLEELKEEMFQLEVEHKRGDISRQEYDKVKGALDQMLERALKRDGPSTRR